jgi:hypothetical protein
LIRLLSHKNIGIATASKWVCFIDQNKYAIFDSRVSIALRALTAEANRNEYKRAFPIIPRRAMGGHIAWTADWIVSRPERIARAYMDYLDVLKGVTGKQNVLNPAQVEMALFMLGDIWADDQPPLLHLTQGMWQ